jgi:hypothetical protein
MKKKIIKAKLGMGIIGVAADAFKNSQTVRDIGGNLGLIPKLLSDKYNKEEEEKEKQLRASQQVAEPTGMMDGGSVLCGEQVQQSRELNFKEYFNGFKRSKKISNV